MVKYRQATDWASYELSRIPSVCPVCPASPPFLFRNADDSAMADLVETWTGRNA